MNKPWPLSFLKWFQRSRSTKADNFLSDNRRRSIGKQLRLEVLESRDLMAVTYHGGALLSAVEAQPVYLGVDWNSSTLATQRSSLDSFASYIVQSPYMDMLNQAGYRVGRGSASAGVVDATTINKQVGITDSKIQSELQSMISSSKLATPDANRLYVVYVQPGTPVYLDASDSSINSFLGYHGAFGGRDASGKSVDIRYAVMAYPGSPNPSASSQGFASALDQLTSVTTHELAEAVTDPDVNYKSIGWYDDQLNGEIGDLTSATTRLNGYLVQGVVNKSDQTILPSNVTTPVTAPQNVSATVLSYNSASLKWGAVNSASGYRIYLVSGSQKTQIGSANAGATSAVVTGLPASTTSSLMVEAYNSLGIADSSPVSVTTPAAPALTAPQNFQAQATSSSTVSLSWSAVSAASGYRVYQVDNGTRVLVGTKTSSASTSLTVSGLIAGSTHSYQVEAYNGSTVADSSLVSVTLPTSSSSLSVPQVTATAVSTSAINLSWTTSSSALGYRIYYWNGLRAVLLGTVSSITSSVKVTGLSAATKYQFVVQAYNATDYTNSGWVNATTKSR
ncbi:MAG: fibronectin type III domain-containing protein [Pirellulales bacterium]